MHRKVFMLKVSLRKNSAGIGSKKFYFRSSNSGVLTTEQLVTEMATFNTTITEADTLGVLNVMKRLIVKYVNLGFTVHTPLGYFHASASGSTDDMLDDFMPTVKENNHQVAVLYRPDSDVDTTVQNGIQIERVSDKLITEPFIGGIRNAAGPVDAPIHAGDTIFIIGDYLKFNEGDEKQGVFLIQDGKETKLTYIPHNSGIKIEARIPADTAAGSYGLAVRTMPSSELKETRIKNPLVITA